jgi:hypothetical protein
MKTSIAGIVILVALAVLVIAQRAPKNTTQNLPHLPKFVLEDVLSFKVAIKGKTSMKAKKEGERWLLLGSTSAKYLNPLAVDQLLHDLQTMQAKRVVVRKTELFQRFAVDENEVMLADKQGNTLLDVFIGKPATDLVSTYIRLADDKRVLTVNKTLTWQIKRTPDAWLEKKDVSPE